MDLPRSQKLNNYWKDGTAMSNKKNDKNKQVKVTPKANNDQLGENASLPYTESYNNKGPLGTEKRR